jgi:glycosyltransferase involved in cell wall biosynthesis
VARQEPQKGLDVLLDAAPRVLAALPSARILIAGKPGNATASLRARLASAPHGEAVAFLGARDDVAELLCAADLFVLPSRREGLGGALLEAMALECPAVLSDIPAFREVADDSMAALVPPDDAVALADAVVAAITDPEATRGRAVAAYGRFLDEYTIDRVVDRMVGFYRGALRG